MPIISKEVHYVSRVGSFTESNMEIEPFSLFVKTESNHHLTMSKIMEVTIVEELDALTVDKSNIKRKYHFYALLTTFLVKVIQPTDMEIDDVIFKVVESIKPMITPPAEVVTVEDEDTILTMVSAPYDSLLNFLCTKQIPVKLTNKSNYKTQTCSKTLRLDS